MPPLLPAPFSLVWLDGIDSTNDEARRRALSGAAADCLVVAAAEQSAGRGRRGRVWVSPPGNLHCSLVLATGGDLAKAAQAGFVAAVALVDALSGLLPGRAFAAKWPNDVLAEGRKCAGMLLEPAGEGWLVLGLGIDVAAAPPPDGMLYPATALADLGYGGDAGDVLAAFCAAFVPRLAQWRAEGFAPVRDAWLARARGLGAATVVRLEGETLTGAFAGLDGDGALLLDQPGTGVRRILAGDVFFPPV
ncbi:biotin--[acetyl-CoA-carboxylase] ligase [Magnetospirillum sp. UT-4]|uniref:biotin--[acetyl-CoA-carboxylase] ligase n=1 Tax=Magnetospirillum sp. UT-4 TaxID=2681467 RepID=UPI00137E3678|nr:biotin--[acetyl-CoA-carboxylase] ligase [Magnetospirillum sp. UT-4]CAA7625839.1 Biotin--(acetyl-CoA-carboxylase) ligase [Magnetospirillum sp. UT-4]